MWFSGIALVAAAQPLNEGGWVPWSSLSSRPRAGISSSCWLRGSQAWTEQDEPFLQTRVSDVSVTPPRGTDPVRSEDDSARVAPAFADPFVSLQAPYSPRRVYSATRVSGLCEMQWLVVALG